MQQASMPKPNVLIVDDEENVRFILESLLNKWGYQAVTACGAQEGLDALEKNTPLVVLSDINMPRTNGLELLQTIRQRHPEIPVVMMSGEAITEQNVKKSLRLGAFGFIPKPFEPKYLKQMLAEIQSSVSRNRKNRADNMESYRPGEHCTEPSAC